MIVEMGAGWGLGYFGQPHIITKFMGIKNIGEIAKSKWIGMSWMLLSLSAATFVGLISIAYFSKGIADPERVFIEMVRESFPAFIVGFLLCAILAATINVMCSQILVLSSSLTEDFYKKIFRPTASSRELLAAARVGILLITALAFLIAAAKLSTIYSLVLYAWSGLGASFGPLLLLSLYSKKINKYGAWCGILSGGLLAAFWPSLNKFLPFPLPALLPSFFCSFISILLVSHWTRFSKRKA